MGKCSCGNKSIKVCEKCGQQKCKNCWEWGSKSEPIEGFLCLKCSVEIGESMESSYEKGVQFDNEIKDARKKYIDWYNSHEEEMKRLKTDNEKKRKEAEKILIAFGWAVSKANEHFK